MQFNLSLKYSCIIVLPQQFSISTSASSATRWCYIYRLLTQQGYCASNKMLYYLILDMLCCSSKVCSNNCLFHMASQKLIGEKKEKCTHPFIRVGLSCDNILIILQMSIDDGLQKAAASAYVQLLSHYVIRPSASQGLGIRLGIPTYPRQTLTTI